MNNRRNEIDRGRKADAIGVWENEGGALGRDSSMEHLYGRRVEVDRSWTVYHVFTGVPARIDGDTMIGMSRSNATDRMMFLNLRNVGRRKERMNLSAPGRYAGDIAPSQP